MSIARLTVGVNSIFGVKWSIEKRQIGVVIFFRVEVLRFSSRLKLIFSFSVSNDTDFHFFFLQRQVCPIDIF